MLIKDFKAEWEITIKDSEIQRNNIWSENFKLDLLNSILSNNPIGAITLFKQNDRNYLEIIDGKQRIYALESFWKGELSINNKYIHNLTEKEQNSFWNYDLLIQKAQGTFEDKVNIFNKINKNIMPLKPFELLRAQFYGNLLLGLLDYVKQDKNLKVCLKENIRGYNELIVLNIIKQKQDLIYFLKENKDKDFNDFIKIPRQIFLFINDVFKSKNKIKLLIELSKDYRIYKVDLIENKDNVNKDIKLLENSYHIEGWNQLSSYERILDRYIIEKDSKRLFSKETKEKLWEQDYNLNNKVLCKLCLNEIDNIDKSEVDHILSWSRGGKTILENAQLVHKYCNIRKGKN